MIFNFCFTVLKVVFNPIDFPKTPLNLGSLSFPLGIISSFWLFGTSLIMFLPTVSPVTTDNMNWLFAVFSIVFFIGAVNWVLNSRHTFTGPKRHLNSISEPKINYESTNDNDEASSTWHEECDTKDA